MNNTLYQQIVHITAVAAIAVLVGLGKLDQTTGLALLGGLVGIALPSPFQVAPSVAQPVAVPVVSPSAPAPSTPAPVVAK